MVKGMRDNPMPQITGSTDDRDLGNRHLLHLKVDSRGARY